MMGLTGEVATEVPCDLRPSTGPDGLQTAETPWECADSHLGQGIVRVSYRERKRRELVGMRAARCALTGALPLMNA
jgi:hypothetical protein